MCVRAWVCVCGVKWGLKKSQEAQFDLNCDIDSAIISWKHRHQVTLLEHRNKNMSKTWSFYSRAIIVHFIGLTTFTQTSNGSQRTVRLTLLAVGDLFPPTPKLGCEDSSCIFQYSCTQVLSPQSDSEHLKNSLVSFSNFNKLRSLRVVHFLFRIALEKLLVV